MSEKEKEAPESGELVKRSLWPKPGTPEAEALGFKCNVIKKADGKILYSLTKECPVPNHG